MLPSARSEVARTPYGASPGVRTTAPAPSPNRTHVVRSRQSVYFDSSSAPTSSTAR